MTPLREDKIAIFASRITLIHHSVPFLSLLVGRREIKWNSHRCQLSASCQPTFKGKQKKYHRTTMIGYVRTWLYTLTELHKKQNATERFTMSFANKIINLDIHGDTYIIECKVLRSCSHITLLFFHTIKEYFEFEQDGSNTVSLCFHLHGHSENCNNRQQWRAFYRRTTKKTRITSAIMHGLCRS